MDMHIWRFPFYFTLSLSMKQMLFICYYYAYAICRRLIQGNKGATYTLQQKLHVMQIIQKNVVFLQFKDFP